MADIGMRWKAQSKPKVRVGLDIGSYAVKVVEVSPGGAKPRLTAAGARKIQGASRELLAGSIRSLIEEAKVSSKDVNISLSGPALVVRLISMPRMSEAELKGAVRFETEKFIPFDINECILDYQILGKEGREKNSIDILLAAAKKDHVLQRIRLAEEAGLTVNMVDVDMCAAANAFLSGVPSEDPAKTIALVNIGASSTSMSILRQALPVFVREITIGANGLNAALMRKFNISAEAAEELRFLPKERVQEVQLCLRPVMSNLLDEIKLSFGYYENQSGRGVDEVYISGGGAGAAGLSEYFQETFGMQPGSWDPFRSLDTAYAGPALQPFEHMRDQFAVAVGLALR